jgi:hypothetical protein
LKQLTTGPDFVDVTDIIVQYVNELVDPVRLKHSSPFLHQPCQSPNGVWVALGEV